MKKNYIIIGIVVLLVLWAIGSYNGLVRQNKAVDNQLAQVETQYQRRFDLIPRLVDTVKGATKQELAFVQEITDARAAYNGAKTAEEKDAAAARVEAGLGRLIAISEANPQIATLPAFQSLMQELEGTENRIATERKRYNEEVTILNTKVSTFPSNIFAKLFGFGQRTYFDAAPGSENAPQVNF
jgi:LemA protein